MKSVLTEYMSNCAVCGRPTTEVHHLCFSRANRKLSDEDKLVLAMCRDCHEELHKGKVSQALSKMLGQIAWEKEYGSREEYRKRYGQSYL